MEGDADHGAVGDVRVVAGVFDDGGACGVEAPFGEGERGFVAAGEGYLHRVGEVAGAQGGVGRFGGGSGAGAGGPAAAEMFAFHEGQHR